MALNLWKLGGQPTSFNPLPKSSWSNSVMIGIGEYLITFKAKSDSRGLLQFGQGGAYKFERLDDEFRVFEYIPTKNALFYLFSNDADIIIQDIELVEKSLPKMTINGIDGFLSGKWVFPDGVKVIDDETVEWDVKQNSDRLALELHLEKVPHTVVVGDITSRCSVQIKDGGSHSAAIGGRSTYKNESFTFTPPNNQVTLVVIGTLSTEKLIVKLPSLNLGTTPAPYEPKRGERMVMPVLSTNNELPISDLKTTDILIKNNIEGVPGIHGFVNGVHLTHKATESSYAYLKPKLKSGVTYTFSGFVKMDDGSVPVPGSNSSAYDFSVIIDGEIPPDQFVIPVGNGVYRVGASRKINPEGVINTGFIKYAYQTPKGFTVSGWQLEEGAVATPYEPYAVQVNKKPEKPIASAKQGLNVLGDGTVATTRFQHNTDKFTAEAIFTFRGRGVNTQTSQYGGIIHKMSYAFYLHVNDSTSTLNLSENSTQNVLLSMPINRGERYYVRVEFDRSLPSDCLKMYLNDKLVATSSAKPLFVVQGHDEIIIGGWNKDYHAFNGILEMVRIFDGANELYYDFTNPNNIVGDKLIPNAKNLIPSFEDERWSLHSNFKVLGPNVGRLEATASNQISSLTLNVSQGRNYLLRFYGKVAGTRIDVFEGDTYTRTLTENVQESTFIPTRTTLTLSFKSTVAGTFDFIKPQLYELTGKEATLFGNPQPLLKAAKRVLYAKR